MKVVVSGNRAHISSPVPSAFAALSSRLEGHKVWVKTGGFTFEPTHHNLRLIRERFPDAEVADSRESLFPATGVVARTRPGSRLGDPMSELIYSSRTAPFGPFQTIATEKGLRLEGYGLFMEQGTGKSKVAIDIAGTRWCRGEITGFLIIGFNGVHSQWIEEAIPAHLGSMVERRSFAYESGKKVPDWIFSTDKLSCFAINFEATSTKVGRKVVNDFVMKHGGNVLCVVDEGQRIKNAEAKSSAEIFDIGRYCKYRIDCTGTPIVKNLTDIWSQFKFIQPELIGHKYKTTFQAQYCIMNPFSKGMVVGSKREKEFYQLIESNIYRVTKAEALDLPPKIYDTFAFELHPEQRKLYDSLRATFRAQIDSGEVATVKNALTLIMRLQQITCGYLALDKDDPDEATKFQMLPNPRLDALKIVLSRRQGKHVVWARFTKDISICLQSFNNSVSYFGGDKRSEKVENKRLFINNPDIMNMFSNQAAGGTGMDGLQTVARTAVYYSNSHNAAHRWQSEDRIDRIGMGTESSYICDLVARRTVDAAILRNLRKKKELSDLVLDDIRQLLDDGDDE